VTRPAIVPVEEMERRREALRLLVQDRQAQLGEPQVRDRRRLQQEFTAAQQELARLNRALKERRDEARRLALESGAIVDCDWGLVVAASRLFQRMVDDGMPFRPPELAIIESLRQRAKQLVDEGNVA
jgi:hypothetical protein